MAKCGAKAKSTGKPCQRTGMANGRCMMHGGMTPETNQNARKHGIYGSILSEEEKADWDLIEVGKLSDELKIARFQLRRALSYEPGHEYYKPDAIDKLLNTVGRLEKQHAEITAGDETDGLDWAAIAKVGSYLTEEVDSIKISRRTKPADNGKQKI